MLVSKILSAIRCKIDNKPSTKTYRRERENDPAFCDTIWHNVNWRLLTAKKILIINGHLIQKQPRRRQIYRETTILSYNGGNPFKVHSFKQNFKKDTRGRGAIQGLPPPLSCANERKVAVLFCNYTISFQISTKSGQLEKTKIRFVFFLTINWMLELASRLFQTFT